MLEDFGCDLGCKLLCEPSLDLVWLVGKCLRVSVPVDVSVLVLNDRVDLIAYEIPYVEPVQVEVGPLLRLPPMLALAL
jgi:hypothetical protein